MLEADIERVGQALLALVAQHLSIPNIRLAAAAAGLDATALPAQAPGGGSAGRDTVVPALYLAWRAVAVEAKQRALPILAGQLLPDHADVVTSLLSQHGFRYEAGAFIPADALNEHEKTFLPASSHAEITRAFERLGDNDVSGAITNACGAVDTLMQRLYEIHPDWGPIPQSFQAKVNTALRQLHIFELMQSEFNEIGMAAHDASLVISEWTKATKAATNGLQVIRHAMGDVHGTKPALRRTAYDAVKWSSAICALFEGLDA